jgi:hypothetical protein
MQRFFLCMALLIGGTSVAQGPERDPGQEAAEQAAARLQEEPEAVVVSVFVLGTVAVKGNTVSIQVKTARQSDGAGLKELIGKSLKVTGAKIQRLEQMAGKEVELRGQVTNGAEFDVRSYSERRTVTAAESAEAQGARGAVGAPRGALNARGPGTLPSATGVRTPIGALNDPKGAGMNKPNTGAIGALQGRKKPMEPELGPDMNAVAAAAAASVAR